MYKYTINLSLKDEKSGELSISPEKVSLAIAAPPEFEEILDHPRLKSLKQRIAVRARIQALSAGESAEYIQHRLSLVSTGEEPAFTKSAIKMIAAKAQGIPRVINVLCDAALVSGLGYHEKPVDAKIVREVIAETGASRPTDLGLVMRSAMPRLQGKADGKTVNEIARALLSSPA